VSNLILNPPGIQLQEDNIPAVQTCLNYPAIKSI